MSDMDGSRQIPNFTLSRLRILRMRSTSSSLSNPWAFFWGSRWASTIPLILTRSPTVPNAPRGPRPSSSRRRSRSSASTSRRAPRWPLGCRTRCRWATDNLTTTCRRRRISTDSLTSSLDCRPHARRVCVWAAPLLRRQREAGHHPRGAHQAWGASARHEQAGCVRTSAIF